MNKFPIALAALLYHDNHHERARSRFNTGDFTSNCKMQHHASASTSDTRNRDSGKRYRHIQRVGHFARSDCAESRRDALHDRARPTRFPGARRERAVQRNHPAFSRRGARFVRPAPRPRRARESAIPNRRRASCRKAFPVSGRNWRRALPITFRS